jgi:hypothetical protein
MKLVKTGVTPLLLGACLFIIMSTLTACNLVPDSGEESDTVVDIQPGEAIDFDPSTLVCNPMDGEASTAREQGIRGSLYYLDSTQPRYNTVDEYLTYGHAAQGLDRVTGLPKDIELYFNQIYIPTRPFDRGFVTLTDQTLVNAEGNTLYEYFAVRHEGRIQLGSKPAGLYQLAILSDDGSTLKMDFGSGYQAIINNDNNHPTRMGCAVAAVDFSSTDKIPYVLDYYQGPRFHISLVLMWRPWPMSAADPTQPASVAEAQDAFCGVQGNSFYFDSTQSPPAPTANYNALLARGWAPLAPENYLLPETTAVNPCNEPAPVITNFRVTVIGTNSATLAWDTDRPATSQVFYRLSTATVDALTTDDGMYRTSHAVTVTGLTSNSNYTMRAASSSTSGLTSESAPLTIRTRR